MAKKKPDVPLENERHEMFCRCLAAGNDPFVCYFGVGYPRDREGAIELAKSPIIRKRAKEYHAILKPAAHKQSGYRHPV